jgi:putative spermidine/putrescine transport system substrate-binding protein
LISEELSKRLPTSPQNASLVVKVNPEWWVENQVAMQKRFALFVFQ